ncbi:MAG: class I tRNA ligase family protein, partial [Thermodesulfobacteriota bacterium]
MSKTEKYDHINIETRWQTLWAENEAFKSESSSTGDKYYLLEMFPYPSGKIHMGHVRNYSIGDVVARYMRMKGRNVFHPMGWDSFGLPAENAAIEKGTHPKEWTFENIDNMRTQLKRMGLSYDWSREIATATPQYYRWNQWFFIKFIEKGLAYRKRSSVNWCPGCSTVLANEQVEEGHCWRCESVVEDKELDQWFLKITEYKDELLEFTEKLPGWPERVLASQQNWIGKSFGADIEFQVDGTKDTITVFTTRPDTLYGATFMSIAPESDMVHQLTTKDQIAAVSNFVTKFKKEKATKDPGQMDKEGVFTGSYCV